MGDISRLHDFTAGTTIKSQEVDDEFNQLVSTVNNLDADNLATAVKQRLGLSDSTTQRSGKSIIVTEESTASTSYTTLTTPDQVSNVTLPTDGLIFIALHALVKNTTADANMALFLNSDQIVVGAAGAVPTGISALANQGKYGHLTTTSQSMTWYGTTTGDSSTVTTGQVVGTGQTIYTGGVLAVWAAAGAYTVSLRFKNNTGGTVFAKERKLWVWTRSFG